MRIYITTLSFACVLPLSLMGMEGDLDLAKIHLKNKREAIARVLDEFTGPLQEDNAQNYLDNKLNKAVARAQRDRKVTLEMTVLSGLLGTAFAIPVVYPSSCADTRWFCGFFSLPLFGMASVFFYNYWHFKNPMMEDIVAKIKTKLNRPYQGKRLVYKRLYPHLAVQNVTAK